MSAEQDLNRVYYILSIKGCISCSSKTIVSTIKTHSHLLQLLLVHGLVSGNTIQAVLISDLEIKTRRLRISGDNILDVVSGQDMAAEFNKINNRLDELCRISVQNQVQLAKQSERIKYLKKQQKFQDQDGR